MSPAHVLPFEARWDEELIEVRDLLTELIDVAVRHAPGRVR